MIEIRDRNGECIDVDYLAFSAGERHVQLYQLGVVGTVFIRANLNSSDDIVDLVLVLNALYEQSKGDIFFHLEIPYFPYARQDRVCSQGQAFSLQVLSRMLTAFAVDAMQKLMITTWDIHSQVSSSMLPIRNIESVELIRQSSELVNLIRDDNSILIAPDHGAINRTQKVADMFDAQTIIYARKIRNPENGDIVRTEIDQGGLIGKTAIIIDDICDGGMTFIKLAEELKQQGVERIILYVTHGIFSKGLRVFSGLIHEIYTTDSLIHLQDRNNHFIQPDDVQYKVIKIQGQEIGGQL